MKIFTCPACGADLYFDNLHCTCGQAVAFDPDAAELVGDAAHCANRDLIDCNWAAAPDGPMCGSCRTTRVRPDLEVAGNLERWTKAERAKRRVLAGLMRWGWCGTGDAGPQPVFDMLAEATAAGPVAVTMGHAGGLVTINLAEADASERVRRGERLGEPYRTLVGHFRHELAHYLFERLATAPDFPPAFRDLFGDETQDYAAALARHYDQGPPANWQDAHVTPYAAAHPHEDWAESAAHAMHVTDIVDSFQAAGLSAAAARAPDGDAFAGDDPGPLFEAGFAIGVAMNHVNRAMGQPDLYPFVNSPRTREKLGFAWRWLATGPQG